MSLAQHAFLVMCSLCSKVQFLEGINEVDLVHDTEDGEGEGQGRRERSYFTRCPSLQLGVDRIDVYSDIDFH